jgi:hypothetical protein
VAGLVKQAGELVERGRRKRVGDQRGDRLVDGHLLAFAPASPTPSAGCRTPARLNSRPVGGAHQDAELRSRSEARPSTSCSRPADMRWTSGRLEQLDPAYGTVVKSRSVTSSRNSQYVFRSWA